MKYAKQRDANHYANKYDNKLRFLSYYHQKNFIHKYINNKNNSVLEVGCGNGFLQKYFSNDDIEYKSFDIAKDLHPDYVGDIMTASKVIKRKFSVVCAFEVLEHIRYEDFNGALTELSKLACDYVIFSVPRVSLYLSVVVKISRFDAGSVFLRIPFPLKHEFDGQHYWEIGKRGYSMRKIRSDIPTSLNIVKEFRDPLDPYHQFIICKVR